MTTPKNLGEFQTWDWKSKCPRGWFGWHRWKTVADLGGGSLFSAYEQQRCTRCGETRVAEYRYSD